VRCGSLSQRQGPVPAFEPSRLRRETFSCGRGERRGGHFVGWHASIEHRDRRVEVGHVKNWRLGFTMSVPTPSGPTQWSTIHPGVSAITPPGPTPSQAKQLT